MKIFVDENIFFPLKFSFQRSNSGVYK